LTIAGGDFVIGQPLSGPKILVKGFGGQLQYVKIGIVMTIILDRDTYLTSNPAGFQYSGIYMPYTLFNANNPLKQPDDLTVDGQSNYNYFSMLNYKYTIYGLSAFQISTLPSSVTVVNYDISFPDINTITVRTDTVNYISNVQVSADRWNSLINTCSASATIMYNIKEKYFATVPGIQVGRQNIHEASSSLDFFYTAAPIGDATQPLSSSVTFTNTLYFEKFTVGMAYKLAWVISSEFDGTPTPDIGYSVASQLQYVITIQGNQIIN
jgi:hypothetical protein